nr:MAG TPA: hypothetical protein [Caudoviricetes sp.]
MLLYALKAFRTNLHGLRLKLHTCQFLHARKTYLQS